MSQRSRRRSKRAARLRRHARVRRKVHGTPTCPRLNVFRSLSNIYVQVIDDTKGHTLAAASTLDGELVNEVTGMNKTDAARRVGALVAKRAVSEGITTVVFDRGGYKYHGRVKALAEGAREGGLKF